MNFEKNRSKSMLFLILVLGLPACNTAKKSGNNQSNKGPTAQQIAEEEEAKKAILKKNPDYHGEDDTGDESTSSDEAEPGSPSKPNAPMGPASPESTKIWPKVGIRNFTSAMSTMAALTGIPKSNPRVLLAYNANKGSLPSEPYADNLTNSAIVGLFKISSSVCDELTKDVTARTAVFGNFNFAGLPQAVFNDAGKMQVSEAIVLKFWGKDLAKLPKHEANIAMVTEILNEILGMNPANTAATTLKVVSGTCTSALMATQAMSY